MSRGRSKRLRRQQSETRRKAEQQSALKVTAVESRGSIQAIVMQRMTTGGVIQSMTQTEKLSVAGEKANGDVAPQPGPTIKISQPSDQRVLPTVVTQPSGKTKPWPDNWPKCPPTAQEQEWRMSLENRDYYELQAVQWAIEHPDEPARPWFAFPKHTWQYTEFVYVTVDMAKALMSRNTNLRHENERHTDDISRDMGNERWMQSHESMAINTHFNMHDGQHRAEGIIKSGHPTMLYITWNVPPPAMFVADSGLVRPLQQKMSLVGDFKLGSKTAPLCRAMMQGLSSRGQSYTHSEVGEFGNKHIEVINWIAKNFMRPKGGHSTPIRADIQAVVAKAYLWYGESLILPFVQRFVEINWTGDNDPVKHLYLWVTAAKNEGRANAVECYQRTLAAAVAHAEHRPMARISLRKEDIFEWLPGWDVPPHTSTKLRPASEVEE
jgi:hypothetical protein